MECIAAWGRNIYDAAVLSGQGLTARKFQACNTCNNSYSIAKAFTMTAIGLLQDDGRLKVEDPISQFLPLTHGCAKVWHSVTIEHALTHTIGFTAGFLDIDLEDVQSYPSPDYLDIIFSHPLAYQPGTHAVYSDAAYYLLARIVLAAGGKELDEVLRERLVNPLEFRQIAWSRCPLGHPIGATGLYVSAEDMVKLGWLYGNGGKWQDRQILSEYWVKQALRRGYEFRPVQNTRLYAKGGLFGQMLLFDPEQHLACGWHSFDAESSNKPLLEAIVNKLTQN